ncbi:MAG: penicillin-binding protein 2 [Alphaproteobacteria bacterium]|nr:penicillin-binding protein 2 [Alphaproteobacteria bacterium]
MNFWRSQKRPKTLPQPSLPGLFSPASENASFRRLATPGEHALEIARARLVFTSIMFSIMYVLIAGRIVDLTMFSDSPDTIATTATTSDSTITSRADITDRNGTVLATSLPTVSLCANAKKMFDADDAVQKLLTVLPDLDGKKLVGEIKNTRRCVMIKRHITPKQSYAINKLGIAGLEFMPDERRIYPIGHMTSHLLGYTNIDNAGLAGVEKFLDARLQQESTPVELSIDLRLQTILHRELSDSMAEFRAVAASGLIMDISNGEIIGMVSLPDFDPHRPSEGEDEARFNGNTLGVYEMGSTFKIFNTALALESGLMKPSDLFNTTHSIEIAHRTISDYHPESHWLNVAEIFTHSSNVGSALMAERMGGIRQRAFLSRLGLTGKVSLELPEVGAPLVPSASNWSEITTMTIAYGHGIAVNAVQMASAVAGIINDGVKVQPTLLKASQHPSAPNKIVSSRTSQQMRALMRLVVTHGTAKQADVSGYLVGGKTGTADKLNGKHYNENARRASFIGVFPITSPRYLVMVILDEPKATAKTHGYATAGWTTAPLVGKVIGQIGPLLGISPIEPDIALAAEQKLLKNLGTDVLDRMNINTEEDYAANESSKSQ